MDLEHEAVELGLGELVGALLLDRVLRGEDEERIGKREGFFANGDLAFLHRLEQGALDFGRGAVDFVGEDEVRKNRAELGGELAVAGIVDQRADEVGGEEVRSELKALEAGADRVGECADGERLGQAGNAFEEHMAVAKEADEQAVDEDFLPDDHAGDFIDEGFHPLAVVLDMLGELGGVDTHEMMAAWLVGF